MKHDNRLPQKHWVQTELQAHERWAELIREAPVAAEIMHFIVSKVGHNNAVVISQRAIAEEIKRHINTVQRNVSILRKHNWIEVVQIGDRKTVNAYVINDRVAWFGSRDKIRSSLFTATIVAFENEQNQPIRSHEPLIRIPTTGQDEQQMPVGDGLPPPSEPSLPGLEPSLPATQIPTVNFRQIEGDDD